MKVLVACEYSGRVREAFRAMGHDAWSCDLLPADDDSPYHIQGDCLDVIAGWMPVTFTGDCDPDGDGWCSKRDIDPADCDCIGPTEDDVEYKETEFGLFAKREDFGGWDLLIAHPPCTYLTCSAEWAYKERHEINKKLSPDKLYGAERRAQSGQG